MHGPKSDFRTVYLAAVMKAAEINLRLIEYQDILDDLKQRLAAVQPHIPAHEYMHLHSLLEQRTDALNDLRFMVGVSLDFLNERNHVVSPTELIEMYNDYINLLMDFSKNPSNYHAQALDNVVARLLRYVNVKTISRVLHIPRNIIEQNIIPAKQTLDEVANEIKTKQKQSLLRNLPRNIIIAIKSLCSDNRSDDNLIRYAQAFISAANSLNARPNDRNLQRATYQAFHAMDAELDYLVKTMTPQGFVHDYATDFRDAAQDLRNRIANNTLSNSLAPLANLYDELSQFSAGVLLLHADFANAIAAVPNQLRGHLRTIQQLADQIAQVIG